MTETELVLLLNVVVARLVVVGDKLAAASAGSAPEEFIAWRGVVADAMEAIELRSEANAGNCRAFEEK